MRTMQKLYVLLAAIFMIAACNKPDNLVPISGTGGLLEQQSPALNYVVGDNKPYTMEFKVFQGNENKTKKIDVYASFHTFKRKADGSLDMDTSDAKNPKKQAAHSNEVLIKSVDITEAITHFKSVSVTFAELTKDIKVVNGGAFFVNGALPNDDTKFLIGDKWSIRFVSHTEDGQQHQDSKLVDITVSTRFAGTYRCIKAVYRRLNGAPTSVWTGETVSIKSVDAKTYLYADWGAAVGFGTQFYFQIEGDKIIIPLEWPAGTKQKLNNQPLISLESNPNDLADLAAETATPNTVVKDDVGGKDKLIMVYGYYTPGSGRRGFYDELQKVVE